MRIGLVRHFKVVDSTRRYWMTARKFGEWVTHYDRADVDLAAPADSPVEWDRCYSSDMIRAVRTAERLYSKPISQTELLREIGIGPVFGGTRLKLHLNLWLMLGRIGWLLNHPSQERRGDTLARARQIIDKVERENGGKSNVLLVTHGAFMPLLRRELIGRGYRGDWFARPENGRIYTYRIE